MIKPSLTIVIHGPRNDEITGRLRAFVEHGTFRDGLADAGVDAGVARVVHEHEAGYSVEVLLSDIDYALNESNSNDAEHDALVEAREWIQSLFEPRDD